MYVTLLLLFTFAFATNACDDQQFEKPFLVLDIDNTLVTTSKISFSDKYANDVFEIKISLDTCEKTFYVLKRPGVTSFLEKAYQYFNVVFFTNAYLKYAEEILKNLMPSRDISTIKIISNFRTGTTTKDLKRVSDPLKRIVLIDDDSNVICRNQSQFFIKIPGFKEEFDRYNQSDYLFQLEKKFETWSQTKEESWTEEIMNFRFSYPSQNNRSRHYKFMNQA